MGSSGSTQTTSNTAAVAVSLSPLSSHLSSQSHHPQEADPPDDEVAAEFALIRLPYQCLSRIASHLSSDDLLNLCQTCPVNCRLFGAEVFWPRCEKAPGTGDTALEAFYSSSFASLNAALERKLCLPVESLNGTYLPSLEDADSYSGRVVYLHDLNCSGSGGGGINGRSVRMVISGATEAVGSGGVGVSRGNGGGGAGGDGGRLCIHDYIGSLPRGSYQV